MFKYDFFLFENKIIIEYIVWQIVCCIAYFLSFTNLIKELRANIDLVRIQKANQIKSIRSVAKFNVWVGQIECLMGWLPYNWKCICYAKSHCLYGKFPIGHPNRPTHYIIHTEGSFIQFNLFVCSGIHCFCSSSLYYELICSTVANSPVVSFS